MYRNAVLLVQLLGNAPGNAVQLHTVHFGIFHILRQQTHKISHTAAGFQDIAGLEAQIGQPLVHGPDHHRRGVERRKGGFPGGGVFVLGQQGFQLGIMGVGFLKKLGQTAPAYIFSKDVLFIWCSQTVFGFQLVQQFYGMNIVVEAFNRHTCTQIICADVIVSAVICGNFGMERMGPILRMLGGRQSGKRLCCTHILYNLTDKGRIVQSLRIYHFAIYDADCFQTFPYLLGVNVIKGIFLYVRCGINNFHGLGMVASHFLGSFFQRIIGAVHILGGSIHDIVMVVVKAIHMILYLDFFAAFGKSLNDLIANSVEGDFRKLFFGEGYQFVKIRVKKLLLGQFFQRVIFSGINDDAVNGSVQPEIHQVNADLNGNFFVRNGGVGNIHFSQVGEIRFAVIFLSAECRYQRFGLFQILIDGLPRQRTKGVVIAKYRECTGQVAFHSLHASLPHFKGTVIGLCCIHEGLHHGVIDGIDLLWVRKLLLDLRNALPIIKITSGGGPLKNDMIRLESWLIS